MDLKLRCSASGCECPNFGAAPSKETLRICDGCSHSWMTHLLEKLLTSRDDALSIFDVCSLALYGTHALPIRIKIVMERLLSTLQPEEVDKILRSFGWGVADLARGYMVQDPRSNASTQSQSPPPPSSLFPHLNNNIQVMTRWTIIPRDEELLILQQFLRFPATRTLSFSLLRDEFPMNLNGMNSTLQTIPTNFPPAPSPLKFNGLFGLGMNLIPGLGITPPPPKREVPSPPQATQALEYKKKQNAALNLCATDNHKNNGYEKHGVVDLSCGTNSNDKKSYNLREPSVPSMHERNRISPSPKPKEHKYEERKSKVPNQVRKQPWEGRSRSPHHHHHHHHMNSPQQQPIPPSSQHMHNQLNPPPPPPPPPPPVNMAAAVAASAAAAVNAAAVSAQQLVNPVTGKRRVQCAVCLKTFCDKGALKIHFSAVHLREMHKCTVSGCNMMFSSRRSRNRHSANPNPKLHSPHLRRKISPHDGRTAQPLLLNNPMLYGHAAAAMAAMGRIPPGGNPNNPLFNNGFGAGAIGKNSRKSGESGGSDQDKRDKKQKGPQSNASDSEPDFPVPITMMMNSDDEDDSYMIHNGGNSDDEDDDGTGIHIPDHMMMVMPQKNKDQDSDSFSSTNEEINEKQVLSPEASVGRKEGSRKRKLTNPVRLPSVPDDSNDDFCCYDDGTEANQDNQTSPNANVVGSPPMLLSSNRSASRTPELLPAVEETQEEEKKEAKQLEYNLRKKSHASMAEFDDEEMAEYEEEGGRSGASSPANSTSPIPIDRENPRRCLACAKTFQNHFGVKVHYQNVHLKLMHKCTVEGCNASFPSKRSRDRHSANYNLHRKLLSTSSDNEEDGSVLPTYPSSINSDKINISDNLEEHPTPNIPNQLLMMVRKKPAEAFYHERSVAHTPFPLHLHQSPKPYESPQGPIPSSGNFLNPSFGSFGSPGLFPFFSSMLNTLNNQAATNAAAENLSAAPFPFHHMFAYNNQNAADAEHQMRGGATFECPLCPTTNSKESRSFVTALSLSLHMEQVHNVTSLIPSPSSSAGLISPSPVSKTN